VNQKNTETCSTWPGLTPRDLERNDCSKIGRPKLLQLVHEANALHDDVDPGVWRGVPA
jgi:hypothetical protein